MSQSAQRKINYTAETRMNKTNVLLMVKRDMHELGMTIEQYAKLMRIFEKELENFICMKIEYVPPQILRHYGLKKIMIGTKIYYVKDE